MAALDERPAVRNFCKEMLSWEPHVRMVSPCNLSSGDGFCVATLELSNLDLLFDDYISVLLVYDVQGQAIRQQGGETASRSQGEPLQQLLRALEKLLGYCPSAAGVVVNNESDGRLEVRYLVPAAAHSNLSAVHSSDLLDLDQKRLISVSQHTTVRSLRSDHAPNRHPAPAAYGVQLHVAHANATLSDLGDVSDPRPCLDLLYAPMQHPTHDSDSGILLARSIMAFQLTTFECGSFTLAHTCSHLYADGYAVATFLQSLCSIARGEGLANPPNFQQSRRAALRPREPPSPTITYSYPFLKTSRGQTNLTAASANHLGYRTSTRFVFSMDALELLRSRGSCPDDAKPCTRSQALFALLWTAHARVKLRVHGLPSSEEMTVRFVMNLRTRGVNPNLLAARYMGNAHYSCSVSATLGELCEKPLAYAVDRIKSTMKSLDIAEAVQSVIDGIEVNLRDGLVPFIDSKAGTVITSLVGLPFYDTDCGWGRPMYVRRPSQQPWNRCIILEHPAARTWNVLLAFGSAQEHDCFEESIADYIRSTAT